MGGLVSGLFWVQATEVDLLALCLFVIPGYAR